MKCWLCNILAAQMNEFMDDIFHNFGDKYKKKTKKLTRIWFLEMLAIVKEVGRLIPYNQRGAQLRLQ